MLRPFYGFRYVLITSVDPLKVYVFNDGLARLCTTPYVAPNAKNMSDRKVRQTPALLPSFWISGERMKFTVVVGFAMTNDGHNHRQGTTFARADFKQKKLKKTYTTPSF